MNPTFEIPLIVCRFLHDGSTMFLWGAFGFLSTFLPPGLARDTARRLSFARYAAVAVIVLSMLAMLPLRTAVITGAWASAIDPRTHGLVVAKTSIGAAWIADASASLLLILTLALSYNLRLRATAIAAGLVLASLALTGHARLHEGLLGYLHQANDIVHVLASGAWVGALAPLVLILAHFPADPAANAHKRALDNFSTARRVAVALVVLTGVANTWLIVGGWPFNWRSLYQVLLVTKIIVVAIMIGLAITNHFRFAPKLAHTPLTGTAAIKRSATGEIILGLSAIVLVSVFGLLKPGPRSDPANHRCFGRSR